MSNAYLQQTMLLQSWFCSFAFQFTALFLKKKIFLLLHTWMHVFVCVCVSVQFVFSFFFFFFLEISNFAHCVCCLSVWYVAYANIWKTITHYLSFFHFILFFFFFFLAHSLAHIGNCHFSSERFDLCDCCVWRKDDEDKKDEEK